VFYGEYSQDDVTAKSFSFELFALYGTCIYQTYGMQIQPHQHTKIVNFELPNLEL